MKVLLKKYKIWGITLLIGITSFISYSFVDNYFEISKNLDIFASLYRELNIYYVDETKPGELMKEAIDNMLSTLDPYTSYIPESEIEDYRYMQTGQYGGVGALIHQEGDYVVITEPYEGYPAQKAGIKAGDKILQIEGQDVRGKKSDEISKMLKGQANTNVNILIEREGESQPLKKTLTREDIKIKSVSYYGMISPTTGYIKLTAFTENASGEMKEALLELKKNKDFKSLILDLRGNPGGLLNEAVNIVNLFVNKGTEIVSTRGKIKDWDKVYKAINAPVDATIPIAVLVDRGSASASEIVSGAIQDLDRGIIVGQRSFGKGLVQQTLPLSYNAQLKVTVAKYYIPSGRCIQALDYSHHNEDGSVNKVPDSLMTAFKTKNGREVFDGGGIKPDVTLEPEKYSSILVSLVSKNLIFKYVTKYCVSHPTIGSAKDFKLSDDEYKKFVTYLDDKDYDYTTEVEQTVEKLYKDMMDDQALVPLKADIEALKSKITYRKKEDLITYKDEIKRYIEEEIASRYYYQNGRLESSLNGDVELKEATKILNDSKQYQQLLSTTK